MNPKETISSEELCKLTRLTDARHRQLADEGWFPAPIKARYKVCATVSGLLRYYQQAGRDSKGTEAAERLRKLSEEADRLALENAKSRGELISADWVAGFGAGCVTTMRQVLLEAAGKIQSQYHPGMASEELRRLIDAEHRQTLSVLRGGKWFPDPDVHEEPGESGKA